jgi:predicted GNAT family N-acyltransferase
MPQNYRFQLLIPPHTRASAAFGDYKTNQQLYDQSLSSMQRLRGSVYLKDGAIRPWELDDDGRFVMRGDEQSWHLLLKDDQDATIGCARYLVHPSTVGPESLRILQSSIAEHQEWGQRVRLAVEADLKRAREHNLSYVEIGGWALSEEWRGTRAALEILVASYALAPLWGGCLAACTATVRHSSASILRRIGGSSFEIGGEQLPPYGDPRYGCTMELLRFDSRSPAPRFVPLINQIRATIAKTPAIRRNAEPAWSQRVVDAGAGSFLPHLMPAYG